jgi:hypothetical protein
MITAHLTKVKTGWSLILVNGVKPVLENIISTKTYSTKPEAKKAAKEFGAKPWNYI